MKTIKTLAVVICAAFALCFTQCTKSPEDLIIGSWSIEDAELIQTYGNESETQHFGPEENETAVITFNKDNTLTQVETKTENGITHTSTTYGTYTLEDNKLSLIWNEDEDEEYETQVYNVETLNKQDMVLSMSQSGMDEGILYTVTAKIYLKRQ